MRRLLIFLCLLASFISDGQIKGQLRLDSLLKQLPVAIEDTNKVILLHNISYEYLNINPDKGIVYANEALSLSNRLSWSKGVMNSYNVLGLSNAYKTEFVSSVEYFNKALQLAEETNDKKGLIIILSNFGNMYLKKGDQQRALEYQLKALKLNKEVGNEDPTDYNNIGTTYYALKRYPEALDYFQQALKIGRQQEKYQLVVTSAFGNSGIIYLRQGDYAKALENIFSVLKISIAAGNKNSMMTAYSNIGNIYRYAAADTNINDRPDSLKDKLKNLQKAIYFIKKAEPLSLELNAVDVHQKVYYNLTETYELLGNYPEALRSYRNYVALTDSLRDVKKETEFARKEAVFYYQKKEDSLKYQQLITSQALKEKTLLSQKQHQDLMLQESKLILTNKEKDLQHLAFLKTQAELQTEQIRRRENDKQLTIASKEQALQKAKIQLINSDLNAKERERNVYISGVILSLLFSLFLFRSYRQKQKANQELAVAKERAEQSERFRQQFLANMSHEIRTPMNAVSGMTNLLLQNEHSDSQHIYLDGIKKSSETLLHVINDILDISKIEQGKIELEHIDFSLRTVLENVHRMLLFSANEKSIQLLLHIHPDVPDTLIGDPVRINQVLMNLVGNAIKFTQKGSVVIEVSCVNISAKEVTLKYAVTDTGIGIPNDKQEYIFESFRQANTTDTRKYGGTGLGLSISRELISLQGGVLELDSKVGEGSCFYFSLKMPLGDEGQLATRNGNILFDNAVLDGLNILVADDNEYNSLVAVDTLKAAAKINTSIAMNGKEAIQLLERHDFDLILMDVQMPEMDGYETTRYIRGTFAEPKRNTPVIALTASVLRTDIEKCREAGMNDYVPKPFNTQQLLQTIAKVCGRDLSITRKAINSSNGTVLSNNRTIDLSMLEVLSKGNPYMVTKYVTVFLTEMPAIVNKLKLAADNNDLNALYKLTHSIRPRLEMMGMPQAKELAAQIEYLALQPADIQLIYPLVSKLALLINRAFDELNSRSI